MLSVTLPEDLLDHVGEPLGESEWREVTQPDVDAFGHATGDTQWIHMDVERAKDGPFGGTIAHGYMTLALVVPLFSQLLRVEKRSMGVNYGLNKVRFPSPVPVGSRVRLSGTLASVEKVAGGIQMTADVVMTREGADKPVLVAQVVYRQYA